MRQNDAGKSFISLKASQANLSMIKAAG